MTTTSKTAGNGGATTAKTRPEPRDGLVKLRRQEVKALISLACDALSATHSLAHEMHSLIYSTDGQFRPDQLASMQEEAAACWCTAEYYLRVLGGLLSDYDPQSESTLSLIIGRTGPDEPPF